MPLQTGTSKKVLQANIHTLLKEVGKSKHIKNKKQAIAIAYSKQKNNKKYNKNIVSEAITMYK